MNLAHSFITQAGSRMGGVKRPILYCAISFSAGILAAHFFNIPVLHSVVSSLLMIFLSVVFFKKNTVSHIFLYVALILFGAVYYQNYNILPKYHIANFISQDGEKVFMKGVIVDSPVWKDALYGKEKANFTVRTDLLTKGDEVYSVSGLVKVSLYSDQRSEKIKLGDEIIAYGNLATPQGLKNRGLFDYSNYLKIKNIHAIFTASGPGSIQIVESSRVNRIQLWADSLRRGINDAMTRYVDGRYSGFLKAILTGERAELDDSTLDDFIRTGTVHVIAISGLNIALIAGIFFFIFRLFGIKRKVNLLLTSMLLIFYCLVAGSSPPVVRATIMFVVASIGYIIDRESDILNSLAIAAFIILIGNPNELFDPSFQLSFASIFGIILFSPKIESFFGGRTNYLIKSAAVSISAIIAVSPIVARYFNIFSPIAVIANLIIVPALFIITIVSFVYLFLYALGFKTLLFLAGGVLSLLMQATFYLNHLFAAMPLSYIRVPSAPAWFILIYYVFIFFLFFSERKKELVILLLLAANFMVWGNIFHPHKPELRITFFDVGKGDSMLIEFPNKTTMLIDAGSGGIDGLSDTGRSIVAPSLWNKGISRIDAVISTHFHSDHMGGVLYVLKNFNVGCVMDPGYQAGSNGRLYDKYRKTILQKKFRRLVIEDGDEILGFGDARLFVVNPPSHREGWSANDSSIAIKLEYKNFSALFCADISSKAMESMLKYNDLLRSDILKVPHHGGSTGKWDVTQFFLEEVAANVSVITSGVNARTKNLPHGNINSRSEIYDTKSSGQIDIISDGNTFKIEPFCPKN